MADYGTFGRGIKQYPLATGTGHSSLFDADPFIFYALEFCTSVIQTHVGGRFLEAATAAHEITSAVAMTVPFDPVPVLTSTHFKFPLLSVYRKDGKLLERTIARRHDVSVFEVCYVMPPLDASMIEQLAPLMMAVRDVLDDRVSLGLDPAYTPTNGTAGQSFWVDLAGVEKVRLTEYESGVVSNYDESLVFYALRMRGIVQERAEPLEGNFQSLTGTDLSVVSDDIDLVDVAVSNLGLDQLTTELGASITTEDGTPLVLES